MILLFPLIALLDHQLNILMWKTDLNNRCVEMDNWPMVFSPLSFYGCIYLSLAVANEPIAINKVIKDPYCNYGVSQILQT
jgi:hypothetical protein